MPAVDEAARAALATKTVAELGAAVEEKASGMWTAFKRDATGIYYEGRCLKAAFKESANILRETLQGEEADAAGKKPTKSRYTALRAKLAERLFVEEDVIHFVGADGSRLTEPSGSEERAIHVMTAQGPRDALKRSDFVSAPARLVFHLRWLPDGVCDIDLVRELLEHACWNGIGADRSQGNGRFKVIAVTPAE
jgi:hypothetical protein